MMDFSQQELGSIRDRIKRILDPHLEPNRALERANNITQALMFEHERVAEIAAEMLAALPVGNQRGLALQVARAWDSEVAAIKDRLWSKQRPVDAETSVRQGASKEAAERTWLGT